MDFLQQNAGLILAIIVVATLFYFFIYRRRLLTQPVDHFGAGAVARGFFRSRKQMLKEMSYFQKEFGSLIGQLRIEWERARRLQVLDEIWRKFNEFLAALKQAAQEVGLKISQLQDLQKEYQAKCAEAKGQLKIFQQAQESGMTDERDALYLDGTAHTVNLYEEALSKLGSLLASLGKVSRIFNDIILRIDTSYQFYLEQRDVLAMIHVITDDLRGLADDWNRLDVKLFDPFHEISERIWADWRALEQTLDALAAEKSQAFSPAPAVQVVSKNDAAERAQVLAQQLKTATQSAVA